MAEALRDREKRLRISRRGFLKAGGVGAAAAAGGLGAIPFRASRAFAQQSWDEEYDIVVAGSGAAGLSAACTSTTLGDKTIVFEKGTYVGGTSVASGGGFFIANSKYMKEAGYEDPREDRLKYMARYSWPDLYDPDAENYGLSDHDFAMISTYYDRGWEAIDYLETNGVAKYGLQWIGGSVPHVPNYDYMDHFDENIPKAAGCLCTLDKDGNQAGGAGMIQTYSDYLSSKGTEIRLNSRVERVVLDDNGAVIGVEVSVSNPGDATPSASPTPAAVISVKANKGVIFDTGGYIKNPDMVRHLLPVPYLQGCGAPTNEGDFQKIAAALGAKLGNLHNVYRNEGIYEQGVADPSAYNCIWFHHGDSMLIVNGTGKRFHNERRNYQDRPMAHLGWDPNDATWPNLLGYLVYDQRVVDNWAGAFPYPAADADAPFVIKADTLEELGAAIRKRVQGLDSIKKSIKLTMTDDFEKNLVAEVAKFNGYAKAGHDPDFKRGDHGYDEAWQGEPSTKNPTAVPWPSPDQIKKSMYPLSETGPYYAFIVAASAVDSNGGPVINEKAQVLTWDDKPIPGLYGSGNAIASPGVNAYWVGGMTLGNAHVWGYVAAQDAHTRG